MPAFSLLPPQSVFRCLIIPSHLTRSEREEPSWCFKAKKKKKKRLPDSLSSFPTVLTDPSDLQANQQDENEVKVNLGLQTVFNMLWTYLQEPSLAFRALDEFCSLFDSFCLLHLHTFVSIMPNISFKSNIFARCNPRWERLKSLCGFVALLKHFQSWDHRCHRCRDAWGTFVSLFLSHPVFFLACHLISVFIFFLNDSIIFVTIILTNKNKYVFPKESSGILIAQWTVKLLLWSQIQAVFRSLDTAQTSNKHQRWSPPRRWLYFTLETLQPSQIWLCLKAVWRKTAASRADEEVELQMVNLPQWFTLGLEQRCSNSPQGPRSSRVFCPRGQKTAFTKASAN